MPRMIIKNDGSGVDYAAQGAATDGNHKTIEHPNLDAVVSAVLLAVMDEINTIRTAGAIGLAALTADDWKNKITAKLP